MKKKDKTPEQKIKRLKIIMTIIMIMIIFILFRNCKQEDTPKITENPIETLFDSVLDSLLHQVAPDGYEIILLGEPAKIPQQLNSQYRGHARKLEQKITTLSAMEEIDSNKKEQMLLELNDELKTYMEEITKEENDTRLTFYIDSRRVRFRTKDGKEFACFQQHFHGNHRLKWLIEIQQNINNKEFINYEGNNILQ